MYNATYVFEGRSIHNQQDEDLYDFPKKGDNINIEGKKYFIQKFTLLGFTIIYILV